MSRKKEPMTAEEQMQAELQMEIDVSRFQKQAKYFERERQTYTAGGKMAKQRKLIRILEKENCNVLTDLNIATGSTRKAEDSHIVANLFGLLHENDNFDSLIKEKQAHLKEIDNHIVEAKKRVVLARSKVIGDTQYEEKVLRGQKVVDSLENKLETGVKRFCAIQTENNKLREQIDHLMIERINFNKLWESLITNLHSGKKFMLDLIEQASISYNEREEWCTKLQVLRTRAHGDLIIHTQEMLRLCRNMDEYSKKKAHFLIKGQKRVMNALKQKEIARRMQHTQTMENYLTTCKIILAEIMEFTAIKSAEEFYSKYIKMEEDNFSTLNCIIGIHSESEALTDELVTFHHDIEILANLNDERAQHQTDNLSKLTEKLQQTIDEVNESQEELDNTANMLNQMYSGIDKLFKMCKCNSAPFLELLGIRAEVNEHSVLLYLSVMEDRISEIILGEFLQQKTMRKKDRAQCDVIVEDMMPLRVHDIRDIAPTNPCPLCVEQEQVSDVIDTLQFVQTREEVKLKLKNRLALPDGLERLHNVSACHLPKSRQIIQRRYQ